MPTMQNITIKNSSNADVIYVAKVASAGEKSPAIWSADALNVVPGNRPTLKVSAHPNGPGTTRVVNVELTFPIVETNVQGGQTRVGSVPFRVYAALPLNLSESVVVDAITQGLNLVSSALMRDVLTTGYAPT